MKMSPNANVKYCLEAACLSMLKQTRSPDVANCSNFHLVWVSWWTSVAPGTQNCQTWKKTSIFFTYDRNSQNHHFWSFFHYSRQKFIKNVSSDTLFHCEFCLRIRIWGQLDSGSAQRCLKIHIFANFSRFNAFLSAKISIFRHSWAFPQSNWPQHLILRQNIQ